MLKRWNIWAAFLLLETGRCSLREVKMDNKIMDKFKPWILVVEKLGTNKLIDKMN